MAAASNGTVSKPNSSSHASSSTTWSTPKEDDASASNSGTYSFELKMPDPYLRPSDIEKQFRVKCHDIIWKVALDMKLQELHVGCDAKTRILTFNVGQSNELHCFLQTPSSLSAGACAPEDGSQLGVIKFFDTELTPTDKICPMKRIILGAYECVHLRIDSTTPSIRSRLKLSVPVFNGPGETGKPAKLGYPCDTEKDKVVLYTAAEASYDKDAIDIKCWAHIANDERYLPLSLFFFHSDWVESLRIACNLFYLKFSEELNGIIQDPPTESILHISTLIGSDTPPFLNSNDDEGFYELARRCYNARINRDTTNLKQMMDENDQFFIRCMSLLLDSEKDLMKQSLLVTELIEAHDHLRTGQCYRIWLLWRNANSNRRAGSLLVPILSLCHDFAESNQFGRALELLERANCVADEKLWCKAFSSPDSGNDFGKHIARSVDWALYPICNFFRYADFSHFDAECVLSAVQLAEKLLDIPNLDDTLLTADIASSLHKYWSPFLFLDASDGEKEKQWNRQLLCASLASTTSSQFGINNSLQYRYASLIAAAQDSSSTGNESVKSETNFIEDATNGNESAKSETGPIKDDQNSSTKGNESAKSETGPIKDDQNSSTKGNESAKSESGLIEDAQKKASQLLERIDPVSQKLFSEETLSRLEDPRACFKFVKQALFVKKMSVEKLVKHCKCKTSLIYALLTHIEATTDYEWRDRKSVARRLVDYLKRSNFESLPLTAYWSEHREYNEPDKETMVKNHGFAYVQAFLIRKSSSNQSRGNHLREFESIFRHCRQSAIALPNPDRIKYRRQQKQHAANYWFGKELCELRDSPYAGDHFWFLVLHEPCADLLLHPSLASEKECASFLRTASMIFFNDPHRRLCSYHTIAMNLDLLNALIVPDHVLESLQYHVNPLIETGLYHSLSRSTGHKTAAEPEGPILEDYLIALSHLYRHPCSTRPGPITHTPFRKADSIAAPALEMMDSANNLCWDHLFDRVEIKTENLSELPTMENLYWQLDLQGSGLHRRIDYLVYPEASIVLPKFDGKCPRIELRAAKLVKPDSWDLIEFPINFKEDSSSVLIAKILDNGGISWQLLSKSDALPKPSIDSPMEKWEELSKLLFKQIKQRKKKNLCLNEDWLKNLVRLLQTKPSSSSQDVESSFVEFKGPENTSLAGLVVHAHISVSKEKKAFSLLLKRAASNNNNKNNNNKNNKNNNNENSNTSTASPISAATSSVSPSPPNSAPSLNKYIKTSLSSSSEVQKKDIGQFIVEHSELCQAPDPFLFIHKRIPTLAAHVWNHMRLCKWPASHPDITPFLLIQRVTDRFNSRSNFQPAEDATHSSSTISDISVDRNPKADTSGSTSPGGNSSAPHAPRVSRLEQKVRRQILDEDPNKLALHHHHATWWKSHSDVDNSSATHPIFLQSWLSSLTPRLMLIPPPFLTGFSVFSAIRSSLGLRSQPEDIEKEREDLIKWLQNNSELRKHLENDPKLPPYAKAHSWMASLRDLGVCDSFLLRALSIKLGRSIKVYADSGIVIDYEVDTGDPLLLAMSCSPRVYFGICEQAAVPPNFHFQEQSKKNSKEKRKEQSIQQSEEQSKEQDMEQSMGQRKKKLWAAYISCTKPLSDKPGCFVIKAAIVDKKRWKDLEKNIQKGTCIMLAFRRSSKRIKSQKSLIPSLIENKSALDQISWKICLVSSPEELWHYANTVSVPRISKASIMLDFSEGSSNLAPSALLAAPQNEETRSGGSTTATSSLPVPQDYDRTEKVDPHDESLFISLLHWLFTSKSSLDVTVLVRPDSYTKIVDDSISLLVLWYPHLKIRCAFGCGDPKAAELEKERWNRKIPHSGGVLAALQTLLP